MNTTEIIQASEQELRRRLDELFPGDEEFGESDETRMIHAELDRRAARGYEGRQEARRDRLEARADKKRAEGNARVQRGDQALRAIPFGQPILVGHHSEKRDRNYREKARNNLSKGFALQKEAAALDARAEAVGSAGISSDDPEGIAKLKEKLAQLEALQAKMVAANKALRKGDHDALHALGFDDAMIADLKAPDFMGRTGFPAYALTNNGAEIRRVKARIDALTAAAQRQDKETLFGDVRLIENATDNRVQIVFPGKPSQDVRTELKRSGFRWSPSSGAWQRQLTDSAVYWAKQLIEKIQARDSK